MIVNIFESKGVALAKAPIAVVEGGCCCNALVVEGRVAVAAAVVDVVRQTGAASVTGSSGRHFLLQHFPLVAGTCSTICKLSEPLRHVAD